MSFLKLIGCLGLSTALLPVSQAAALFITGGPTFSALSNVTPVALNPYLVNDYKTSIKTQWGALLGVGAGHSFAHFFHNPLTLWLGAAGYSRQFGTLKGIEYPFANDGSYDTLNYQFMAKSNALMAESRLIYTQNNDWQPFALLGMGGAWNRLSHYVEVPTQSAGSAAPIPIQFSNKTTTSLAYEVGFGVQHSFFNDETHHVRYTGSVDYRYMQFGQGQLGSIPTQTSNDRLHISGLYTQGLLFSLCASIA